MRIRKQIREVFKYRSCLRHGRPYFGPYMGSALVNNARRPHMVRLIQKEFSRRQNVYFLEVGSWAGSSARLWADTLESVGATGIIVCVDWWRNIQDIYAGRPRGIGSWVTYAPLSDKGIFDLFLHNTVYSRGEATNVRVVPFRGNSKLLLPLLQHDQFDLAYIDADPRKTLFNHLLPAERVV